MKKIKYEKMILGKPRCCRLPLDLDKILVTLADAYGVSPGIFIRIEMEGILEKLKPLVEGGQA